jgi:6-phosphogluconolactonase (cycloisomerase 2 family)
MFSRKKGVGFGALVVGATATSVIAISTSGASAAGAHAHDGTVAAGQAAAAVPSQGGQDAAGAAFAMTNSSKDNRIVEYRRAPDGTLTRAGSVSTGGVGIGVDLDTQGPLRLSADNRYLYAVNAGSDDVSVFSVHGARLSLEQKIDAGDEPTALTVHDGLVYVLDGSVASNSIRGFRAGADGRLTPIAGSIQPLSSPIAVPGDIEFSPDGSLLLVTEKTTALTRDPQTALDAFRVDANGVAGPARRDPSHGVRPFALAFRGNNQVLVGESFDAGEGRGAMSSYQVGADTSLDVISPSVPNQQTDTCWVVVTADGRFAYTANFGTSTISSYRIADDGTIELNEGSAAFLGPQTQPVDLAQTADSSYLYVLLRGTGVVSQFRVGSDGALTPIGTPAGGLPADYGVSGLAVY